MRLGKYALPSREREEPDKNVGERGASSNATVDDCSREECRKQHANDESGRLEENQSINGSSQKCGIDRSAGVEPSQQQTGARKDDHRSDRVKQGKEVKLCRREKIQDRAKTGDEPVIFCKFPTTLRGPEAPIELPPESNEVDYEAELVVIIGKRARRITLAEAWNHVAGYACGHDVSARDWQKNKPGKQWLLGKSFDSFAPLGPWLVTCDEVADPGNLKIELRLNGEVMQSSSTSQLIFPIDYLVSYLSHVCTLLPGDLIYTGTPPGVGMARTPPVFMKPGDVAEVAIEGLGTLRNPVVAGGEPNA